MSRLEHKVAIVTGGTRGIGRGVAAALLGEGARVLITGTDAARAQSVAQELSASGRCGSVAADLANMEAVQPIVDAAQALFGRIDILVNNAGVGSGTNVWDVGVDEWDRIVDVNLRAAFFLSVAAARTMRTTGGGSILNVTSIAGQNGGIAGSPAYAAAKAGVIGLTRSLARRFAPDRIRVNALAPADIETDMTAGWPKDLRERLIAITPLARFGAVEEVTGAAVFLASDDASYVTGQVLSINGGAYMG